MTAVFGHAHTDPEPVDRDGLRSDYRRLRDLCGQQRRRIVDLEAEVAHLRAALDHVVAERKGRRWLG